MPTLLQATGAAGPSDLPGINLLDKSAVKKRTTVFGDCFLHESVDLDSPAKNLRWRWCVDGDWKLILPHALNEPKAVPELYNLKSDPHEERNLADKEKKRVTQLTKRLDAWWKPE
jgi:uncharacterized sulfatase